MIDYQSVHLADIMPENLLADERVKNAAATIDTELSKVARLCSEVLLISRIDELPEDVIDLLAWQWHVDFYDSEYDLETKRKLVKQSIDWHRRKGTPSVVREVVAAILKGAVVSENWEYGGRPYCFSVRLIDGDMPDEEDLAKLVKGIKNVKNTRSHLDECSFYRELDEKLYIGTAVSGVFKKIVIGLPALKPPRLTMQKAHGGAIGIHKMITIKGE